MGTLAIIPDPRSGVWYRNVGLITPQSYSIVVRYSPDSGDVFDEPKEYTVKGLDFSTAPTEADALQEAKYKLRLEHKNRGGLTCEQLQARDDYNKALQHYDTAKFMINEGIMTEGGEDTDTTLNLQIRRDNVRAAFILCRDLGLNYAGDIEGMGHLPKP